VRIGSLSPLWERDRVRGCEVSPDGIFLDKCRDPVYAARAFTDNGVFGKTWQKEHEERKADEHGLV